MKWALILMLLCTSCVLAQEAPPLSVYASVSKAEYEAGDLVYLTTTIYSTSPTPSRLAVHFDAAPGLVLVKMRDNGSGYAWQDHPDTLRMVYLVSKDAPAKGALLPLDITVQADGQQDHARITIRNGTAPCCAQQSGSRVWLPLVRRG